MVVSQIAEPAQLFDTAALAQNLLDEAYRADLKIACAECFFGGSIAALFGNAERNASQFSGAFIFNCEHAIGEILGRGDAEVRRADAEDLALDMARAALRGTGASLALGVVAPRGVMRFGPVSFAAMDDRGNRWSDRLCSRDLPDRVIAGQAIAFLQTCFRESLSRRL